MRADFLTYFALKAFVALLYKVIKSSLFNELCSLNKTQGEAVHTENEAVEHIFIGIAWAAVLCIKVKSACKPAIFKNLIHTHCCIIYIKWEFISIPAKQCVALICINTSKHTVYSRYTKLMLEAVSCKSSMICFYV